MSQDLDLRRVRYFVTLAEELNFTRAAARLHLAQSGLSQQIRKLEREVGTELFVRSKHAVALSQPGLVFLDHACRVLDEAEIAGEAARRAARGELGRLVVGFVPSVSRDLMPAIVRKHRARFPDLNMVFRELGTRDQVPALLDGQLHVGMIYDDGVCKELSVELLRKESFVVALPTGHRLASRQTVPLTELAAEPWILGPETVVGYSARLLAACAQKGFAPKVVQVAAGYSTRLLLVAAGIGVTVIPESSKRLDDRDVVYRPLSGTRIALRCMVAWPEHSSSELVSAFLRTVRTVRLQVDRREPTR